MLRPHNQALQVIRTLAISSVLMVCVSPVMAQKYNEQPEQVEVEKELIHQAVKDAQNYCKTTAESATDARIEWQMRALFDVEKRMHDKMTALDAKIAELKKWVTKRDEILKRSEGHVVQIYAQMRADAAAAQLGTLDDNTAVSILLQMKPRQAGAILAEMPSDRAAFLTDTMAMLTARKAKEGQS
ncbi:MotE family protein [Polycladidibacter stylochi]|uniref:MotE family protein n=1 Tax=Polycladidibacter stylochi TaxID=1807766 RepID=UPI000AC6ED48|nr:hypothetical protein [Pseudovibrio stylochi]